MAGCLQSLAKPRAGRYSAMKTRTRSCLICRQAYQPHPRNAKTNKTWGQKTCGRRTCRLAWKRKQWRRWKKLNPGDTDSRRAKVRGWAKGYPDYWRHYRQEHPDYRKRELCRMAAKRRRQKCVAKQRAIGAILAEKLRALEIARGPICVAKQTAILRRVDAIEDCLRSTISAVFIAKHRPIALAGAAGG